MTQEKIQELLSLGEGQRVEFKSSLRNDDVLGRIICGFLNSAGGFLVCGIDDRRGVLGIADSDAEISTLEKRIHDGLSPRAMVSFHVQRIEGRRILVIEVPAGADVPYAFRDAIYIREAEETQQVDGKTRKVVARYQQFRAVHEAVKRLLVNPTRLASAAGRDERGGIDPKIPPIAITDAEFDNVLNSQSRLLEKPGYRETARSEIAPYPENPANRETTR